MDNFLSISFSILLLISSIDGNEEEYCYGQNKFQICGYADTITFINGTGDELVLQLDANNFSAIAPYTFQNVTVREIDLMYLNSTNNSPKFIQLSPESFNSVNGVQDLVLHSVRFSMEPNPFRDLESLTSLTLVGVELSQFGADFFVDFPHLKTLDFVTLKLTKITPDTFSNISWRIKDMRIADAVSAVEPGSFARFKNLRKLVVIGGRFAVLPSGTFNGLNRLKRLYLTLGKIQVLSKDTFGGLTRLKELRLSYNRISEIEASTFHRLNHLRDLHLNHNNLEVIPAELFSNLTKLTKLILHSNKLRIIKSNMFQGCPKLRLLALSDNELHHIEPSAFSRLHLNWLYLAFNNITVLGNNSFYDLHVDELDLGTKYIMEIQSLAFNNLIAGTLSLCHGHQVTHYDLIEWGSVNNSIGKIINNCSDTDVDIPWNIFFQHRMSLSNLKKKNKEECKRESTHRCRLTIVH